MELEGKSCGINTSTNSGGLLKFTTFVQGFKFQLFFLMDNIDVDKHMGNLMWVIFNHVWMKGKVLYIYILFEG